MEKQFNSKGWAHRLGRKAGRGWRGYKRRERQVASWLVARGVPAGGATALLWIVKLLLLVALLYVAFWLALPLVFLALLARGFANKEQTDIPASGDEWRHGEAGYGLYSSSGQRIDPHDPNNPHDENDPHDV